MNFQLFDFSLLFSGLSVMLSSDKIPDRFMLMLFVLLAVILVTIVVWANSPTEEHPDTFDNGLVEHVKEGPS